MLVREVTSQRVHYAQDACSGSTALNIDNVQMLCHFVIKQCLPRSWLLSTSNVLRFYRCMYATNKAQETTETHLMLSCCC